MKTLWNLLVRMVVILGCILGITLLVAVLAEWWERRNLPTPLSEPEIPSAATITAPTDISQPDTPPVDNAHTNKSLDWDREEITELRETIGNDTVAKMLEIFRDRDGAPVNLQEIVDITGRTLPQVRADLATLSRKSHEINGHPAWPIDTVDATDGVSSRAYTINPQYLRWWFGE